ncbi:VOC family protein [Microbispora sp. NBRC 16548]|uniref:VOC family protein n=1 Tax=Microbispora sp. NBRC 16548 TaxID=3030994 RepID=UPI00255719EF|nr:VOC family protein [Microbispora sp. NBRC 16548]
MEHTVEDGAVATAPGRGGDATSVRRLDHVAVAVRDLDRAWALFGETLGGRFVTGGDNDETGIRLLHLYLGGLKIELVQPLRTDSLLARTLERRGEGMHHITFVVDDVSVTVDALSAAGYPMTGTDLSNPVWRETFVKPAATHGALLQFVDTTRDWSKGVDGVDLATVLRGGAVFLDAVPCARQAALGDAVRPALDDPGQHHEKETS